MKSLLPSREQIPVLATLAVIILLGAGYYYIYLPNNESGIKEWRFRTLQNVERNIQEKIKNSFSLLNNLLITAPDSIRNQNEVIGRQNVQKNLAKSQFTISLIRPVDKDSSFKQSDIYSVNQQLILSQAKKRGNEGYQISMTYDFDKFIEPLLPHDDVFDEYIVFGNNQILYETFASGLNYSNRVDSLFILKGEGSAIKEKQISGIDYKLFLQPVVYSSSTKWIVVGLLSQDHFQKERSKLPPRLILLLVTVFLVIFVTLPIVKLYQMGKEDRLTISDGISSVMVFMLLISLLFFLIFKYNVPFRHEVRNPKQVLANSLSSAFMAEIVKTGKTLVKLDSLMANLPPFQRDFYAIKSTSAISKSDTTISPEFRINSLITDIDVSRIFWLDSKGTDIKTWNVKPQRAISHGNFAEREYFKKIQNRQAYYTKKDILPPFYVEQVMSWTSGLFLTVVSIPSQYGKNETEENVAAMSVNLKCFDQVLMPVGYSFAVTDKAGKVLYHSDKTKNLNENLLQEFSEPDELTACLRAGTSDSFHSRYRGHEYDVRIQPVIGLPYHMVIFDDLDFKETRDIEVYTFTISMQLLLFFMLLMQVLIIFFVSARRSVFRIQLFDTSWIGPRESSHRQYFLASFFNICIILILWFFPSETFIVKLFYLLTAVSIIPVFLNLLFFQNYWYKRKKSLIKYKLKAVFWGMLIPLTVNFFAYKTLDRSIFNFWFFEFACLLLATFILFLSKQQAGFHQRAISIFNKFTYYQSFTLFLFTWLLISNGLSVLIFYTASYNYDQHLIARLKQYELGNKLLQKGYRNNDAVFKSPDNLFYPDSCWIRETTISQDLSQKSIAESATRENNASVEILNRFRVYQNENTVRRRNFHISHAIDTSFFFNNLMKEASSEKGSTNTYIRTRSKDSFLKLGSANLNYVLPLLVEWPGTLFWIFLAAVLVLLFLLIYYVIKKLFAINLPDTKYWTKLDKEILKSESTNKLLFMIGLPGSGKLAFLKEMIKNDTYCSKNVIDENNNFIESEALIINMLEIPDKESSAGAHLKWSRLVNKAVEHPYKLLILRHFEYNFQNPETSYTKLHLLEKLVFKGKTEKIIILSTIHPDTVLEWVNKTCRIGGQSIERWEVLLGRFRIIIRPISRLTGRKALAESSYPLIAKETRFTRFLNDMSEPTLKAAPLVSMDQKNKYEEGLVFKLQAASHYYYFYIWQSLTKEEKFVLYDMAEDGIVNVYDQYTVSLLINKGVIIRLNGTLKLFNQGFRNFILRGIGEAEEEIIKQKINDNSNWNKIKAPMALILLTILAFLLSSQHETSTKLITTMSALAAVVPALINFLSSLGAGKAGQSGR